LKSFQEWGGVIKENDGGGISSMIYLIYYKNFCICHNIPLPGTIKKGPVVNI
jgi:hypothetical protein